MDTERTPQLARLPKVGNVTPLFSERELDWHARLIAERDELARQDRRPDLFAFTPRDDEQATADEAARLAGGIFLGFIVGMFVGALLLASAAWAVDTVRSWFA